MGQAATQFDYGHGDGVAPRVVEMRDLGHARPVGRVQDRGTSALAVSIFADRSWTPAKTG